MPASPISPTNPQDRNLNVSGTRHDNSISIQKSAETAGSPAHEATSPTTPAGSQTRRSSLQSRLTTSGTRFAPQIQVQQLSGSSTSDDSTANPTQLGPSQYPTSPRKQLSRINTQIGSNKLRGVRRDSSSSDDTFDVATPYSFRRRVKRRFPGVTAAKLGKKNVLDPDDYLSKYAEDGYCKEMESNARVWRVYLDEASRLDSERVETWRENLDVLLVFAGLFSGVVTTFVVQTSTDLKPDYGEVTARLLANLSVQQTSANTRRVLAGDPNLMHFTPGALDRWVNGLWLISLVFALSTALIAVLCKQWLQSYVKSISGSARDRARIMQSRRDALETWQVETIIGFLPVSLHLSLFIFFAGLALFSMNLDRIIGPVILAVVSSTLAIYAIVTLLPIWQSRCPYVTPLTSVISRILQHRVSTFIQAPFLRRDTKFDPSMPGDSQQTYLSHTDMERKDIELRPDDVDTRALLWLNSVSSPNPTVRDIVVQATAGLNADFKHGHKLRGLVKNLPPCLRLQKPNGEPTTPDSTPLLDSNDLEAWLDRTSESEAERYFRASQHLQPDAWRNPDLYSAWDGQTLYVSNLILSRHPQLKDDIWPLEGSAVDRLRAFHDFTYKHFLGEKAPNLRPYLWQQLLFQASGVMRLTDSVQFEHRNTWQRDTTLFLLNQAEKEFYLDPNRDLFRVANPADNEPISLAQVPPGWLLYFLSSFHQTRVTYEPVALMDPSSNTGIEPEFLLQLFIMALTQDSQSLQASDATKLLQALRSLVISVYKVYRESSISPTEIYLQALESISRYLYSAIAMGAPRPHLFMADIDGNNLADVISYAEMAMITYLDFYTLHSGLSTLLPDPDRVRLPLDIPLIQGLTRAVMLQATKRYTNPVQIWLDEGRIDVMDCFMDSGAFTTLTVYSKDRPPEKDSLVARSIIRAFIRSAIKAASNPAISNSNRFVSYITDSRRLEQCCKFIFHSRFTYNPDPKGQSWPNEIYSLARATSSSSKELWIQCIRSLLHSEDVECWRWWHTDISGLREIERLKNTVGLDPNVEGVENLVNWVYIQEKRIGNFPLAIQDRLRDQEVEEIRGLKYKRLYLDTAMLERLDMTRDHSHKILRSEGSMGLHDGGSPTTVVPRMPSATYLPSSDTKHIHESRKPLSIFALGGSFVRILTRRSPSPSKVPGGAEKV